MGVHHTQHYVNGTPAVRADFPDLKALVEYGRSKSPPLATENLLENTDGVLRPPPPEVGAPHQYFSVLSGRYPATSIHADARYVDAVFVKKATARV